MTIYLVVGDQTFKTDRTSKEVMLRLARGRVLSKTAISRSQDVSQHVYLHHDDTESVVKTMVCSVFNRSIPVTSLAYTMDQIEELWQLAIKRTSVFTDPSNAYLLTMLCQLTLTQSAERITSMVYNFDIIRALYGQLGYNLKPLDRLPQFCATPSFQVIPQPAKQIEFRSNMQSAS